LQVYSLLALIFALLVAIFAIQNAGMVEINFLVWRFPQISLVLVILGSAAFGAIFVFLLGLVKQLKMSRAIWELKSQNKKLNEALARLEQPATAAGEPERKPEA